MIRLKKKQRCIEIVHNDISFVIELRGFRKELWEDSIDSSVDYDV